MPGLGEGSSIVGEVDLSAGEPLRLAGEFGERAMVEVGRRVVSLSAMGYGEATRVA
jgi:hypothetical protein